MTRIIFAALLLPLLAASSHADDDAALRGKKALTERAFLPAAWSWSAYGDVWKTWSPAPTSKPADYAAAIKDHYGLAPAPFPNNDLPLGLRESKTLFGAKGVTSDCMLCHGGSLMGKSVVGLGNADIDMSALFEDLARANGTPVRMPFEFTRVRGTTEAAAMAVYLLSLRGPDLELNLAGNKGFVYSDQLFENAPAWWLLKKKKTMYMTGSTDARSVRSIMQFMLSPTNPKSVFEREQKTFADIQAYILSLEAPKYPLPIDRPLADKGHAIFDRTCAKCHGTYGEKWTYPNKVVPIDVIGTDRARFDGIPAVVGEFYNRSWFAHEKGPNGCAVTMPVGYQAPPLDGVWATAPYFHNGSVPTIADVLDSKSRPKIYTRSYDTDLADYDGEKLGWKVRVLDRGADPSMPARQRRRIYDTTQPGRGNRGHTFGDHLPGDERRAVIEYLKTL
jgi:mono/diheme cytochrome c family protein